MTRRNTLKITNLFLLALFLCYHGSITFFSHHHVVDGITICHSHFFPGDSTDGDQSHSHSPQEFKLIALLNSFSSLPALLVLIRFLVHERIFTHNTKNSIFILSKSHVLLKPLRAPPIAM